MATLSWKIDDSNTVQVKVNLMFGKYVVFLNGQQVTEEKPKTRIVVPLLLKDGRQASLMLPPAMIYDEIQLRVQDKLILLEKDVAKLVCLSCGISIGQNDKVCKKCGVEIPDVETQAHQKSVKVARKSLLVVAGLYVVLGLAVYFYYRHAYAGPIQYLQTLKDSDLYPVAIRGEQYSVGQLLEKLQNEPILGLEINLSMSVVMLVLYGVSKHSLFKVLVSAMVIFLGVGIVTAFLNLQVFLNSFLMSVLIYLYLLMGLRASKTPTEISSGPHMPI
jgi:hypothetical protein